MDDGGNHHTIADLGEDVATLLARHGRAGLDALPHVGPAIAASIEEMVRAGLPGTPWSTGR